MYLHWLEPTILGVVGLWFVMTTSEPDSNHNVIQRVGPKMCDHLRSRMIGCSGYLYTSLYLSCRLSAEKTSSGQQSLKETYYHKVSKIYQAKRNLTCRPNSKIFYTRRNIPKCRRRQLKPGGQVKFTRVLMLSSGSLSHPGRQLYLCNKTVSLYPYINDKYITAVAYILSTKKLLIYGGHTLFLTTLDGTDRTIISELTRVVGITVDEEQQLVFLTSGVNNSVHIMTTEGKDLKLITLLPGKPADVAADSQRQVIYVTVRRQHIARYTYMGQLEVVVVKGYICGPLYFNSKTNVLYYMVCDKRWTVFKMFLSNGAVFTIPSQVEPMTFYAYSNILYFLPNTANRLHQLHVLSDSGKYIATIITGFDMNIYDIAFCAIP